MLEVGGEMQEERLGREKILISNPPPSNLQPQTSSCHERYVFPFEKLEVWQEALELADFVLGLLQRIPQGKHLRLVSQVEGAATSIAQNIAEGKGRQHRKEFLQYLSIAQGSLYEIVTLNEVFRRRKLFDEEECVEIRRRAERIDRKLNGLMNSVRQRNREGNGRG